MAVEDWVYSPAGSGYLQEGRNIEQWTRHCKENFVGIVQDSQGNLIKS